MKGEEELANAFKRWFNETVVKSVSKLPERKSVFKSDSGITLEKLYTPLDLNDVDYLRDIGFPGEFPYTRGIYPLMYRTRIYTMRHYSGWGTAEETNARWKFLLEHGETGLSLATDLPTQMGYDPDHPMAKGEVGKVGVSICNKEDYMRLYDGIPMDTTSVHLQANANSIFMLAFHIVEGLRRGHNIAQLWGTCQNDILKEFISRGTWIFPPEHSLRISCDVIEYAVKNMPKWAPLSVCSYHLQEAGANFVTSMAFSICNAMEYVRNLLNRGLPVDSFGYLISTWDIACHHVSFFEIICGIRAGRRLWAKIMKERFGAKDPKSCMMRIFVGSGGIHMTRAEPLNNIIRGAISAVAAALAGVQSINIQCYDEAYSIPTDQAIKIALRTEQIVAYETDIMSVVDPLGGSYFVENLTNKIEKEMVEIINEIEDMGGALQAIKNGYMQRIITRQAYERQKAIERGEIIRVGENFLRTENFEPIPVFQIDENTEEKIVQRLDSFKRRRNMSRVRESLEALRHACEKDDENLVPYVIRAAESGATLGEMCKIMKEVLGEGVEILLM